MKEQKLHYTSCGLDNVYLLNAYRVLRTRRGTITRLKIRKDSTWQLALLSFDRKEASPAKNSNSFGTNWACHKQPWPRSWVNPRSQ